MSTGALTYTNRINREWSTAIESAHPHERSRFWRAETKVDLRFQRVDTLQEAIASAHNVLKLETHLRKDAAAWTKFRDWVTNLGRTMSDIAWDRWIHLQITRRLMMGGVKTLADYFALPEDTRRAVDQEMTDELINTILRPEYWRDIENAEDDHDENYDKIELAVILKNAEAAQDADYEAYHDFSKNLAKYATDRSFDDKLLKIIAIMKHDRSVRLSYRRGR